MNNNSYDVIEIIVIWDRFTNLYNYVFIIVYLYIVIVYSTGLCTRYVFVHLHVYNLYTCTICVSVLLFVLYVGKLRMRTV